MARIATRNPSTKTPGNMSDDRYPSWMFNGRLSHVVPFAIRGAIWNQGYANMGKGLQYYVNLHSLICGWRLKWGNLELPVYFHQFYCPGHLAPSTDFASAIGHRLAKKSGRPTGVIYMTNKDVPLQSWMKFEHLKDTPSLMAEYENLAQMQPRQKLYEANVRRYVAEWKKYWDEFVPQMIATRAVPNGESSGN